MKNPKFNEYQLILGLKNCKEIKEGINNFVSSIESEFEYPKAVRYTLTLRTKMKVYTIDSSKRACVLSRDLCIDTEETIIPEFELKDNYVYTLLCQRIMAHWNPKELRYYDRRVVKIEFTNSYLCIDPESFIVWSYNEVCTYHIEQECGEGWIKLPLKPINKTCGYTDFTEHDDTEEEENQDTEDSEALIKLKELLNK